MKVPIVVMLCVACCGILGAQEVPPALFVKDDVGKLEALGLAEVEVEVHGRLRPDRRRVVHHRSAKPTRNGVASRDRRTQVRHPQCQQLSVRQLIELELRDRRAENHRG